MIRQQPTFWLEVRKEYIIDNYEKLLPYLRNYRYETQYEAPDSDYNKTFRCLKEVVDDICHSMDEDNVFKQTPLHWDEATLKRNVGLMASYLLSAMKKGITDNHTLLYLCTILLDVEKKPDAALLSDFKKIAACCGANREVLVYGFGWDDVERIPQFSLSLFCQKAGKTNFKPSAEDKVNVYEGKGLMSMNKDTINLAPMNLTDYDKADLLPQFKLPMDVNIMVRRADKTNKTEFPELIETCTDLLRGLDSIAPSIKHDLQQYENGDFLKVRVKAIDYEKGFIECETIDPDYKKIRGGLFIPYNLYNYFNDIYAISKTDLVRALRLNDVLFVRKQSVDHYPFIIDSQIFRKFNDCYIEDMEPHVCDAVHLQTYAGGNGNRWLTDGGVQVNVLGRLDDDIQTCVDHGQPVRIRIIETKQDKSGNWVVNGKYVYDDPSSFSDTYEAFVNQARDEFLSSFLDYYYEAPDNEQSGQQTGTVMPSAVPFLINLFYRSSIITGDTRMKYLWLLAARFLAILSQDAASNAFLRQQMRFEECLVHFALGDETASTLAMRDEEQLSDLPLIHNEKAIVEQLAKYQDMNVERLQLVPGHEVNTDYLAEMISASNILKGKLEPTELNRIKRSIADYLGVADIYRNITRDYTDYGEESDTLEFKTSIVFPPNNNMQADLAMQKWGILKAVCGFLNTVSGGEILLGVNDYGMACGLKNDIDYLFMHRFIGNQTMDSYRRYVKGVIDSAFRDDRNVEGLDVTSTVISYVIERNNEGSDLLRIRIHPYENGIVSFRDDYLPEGIARSYYRTSGASVKMDDKLKKLVKQRKGL